MISIASSRCCFFWYKAVWRSVQAFVMDARLVWISWTAGCPWLIISLPLFSKPLTAYTWAESSASTTLKSLIWASILVSPLKMLSSWANASFCWIHVFNLRTPFFNSWRLFSSGVSLVSASFFFGGSKAAWDFSFNLVEEEDFLAGGFGFSLFSVEPCSPNGSLNSVCCLFASVEAAPGVDDPISIDSSSLLEGSTFRLANGFLPPNRSVPPNTDTPPTGAPFFLSFFFFFIIPGLLIAVGIVVISSELFSAVALVPPSQLLELTCSWSWSFCRFLVGGLLFLGGATLPFVGVEIVSILASSSKETGFSSELGWTAIPSM